MSPSTRNKNPRPCPHNGRHLFQQKLKPRTDGKVFTPSTLCMHPECLMRLVESKVYYQEWWNHLAKTRQQEDFIQFLALFLVLNPQTPQLTGTVIGYARSKFLHRKGMGGASFQSLQPDLLLTPEQLDSLNEDNTDESVEIPVLGNNPYAQVHCRELQQAIPEPLLLFAVGELTAAEAALLLYPPEDVVYGSALLTEVESTLHSWIRLYEACDV